MTVSSQPRLVIADSDPVMRLACFALQGPGLVSPEWVRAYVAPEPISPGEVLAVGRDAGVSGVFDVRMGATGAEVDLLELLPEAAVVLFRRGNLTRRVIAGAPKLQLIQRLGIRPDGIDLLAAAEAGVAVSCMPRPSLAYTAEHALLLMLALAKRLLPADRAVRTGAYDPRLVQPNDAIAYNWAGLQGIGGLFGKTLGIVGLGEVGTLVAQRARAFDMRLLYCNRRRLPPESEAALGVEYCSFRELLGASDFVSLHASNIPENAGLFDAPAFAAMRPGAFFINTARGRLVDEAALRAALVDGRIAGAGLDVHAVEPRPVGDPLAALPNVVLTPHTAGGSRRMLLDELRVMFDNCRSVLGGRPVRYAVAQVESLGPI